MSGSMFFTDVRGNRYPVSKIARIGYPRDSGGKHLPPKVCAVHMDSGDSVEASTFEVDQITDAALHVIPAQPGTYVFGSVEAGDTLDVVMRHRSPVLAWGICADGYPTPIGIDGREDHRAEWVVLLPDGSVHWQLNRAWESVESWFADALAEVEKRAAERAAAGADRT